VKIEISVAELKIAPNFMGGDPYFSLTLIFNTIYQKYQYKYVHFFQAPQKKKKKIAYSIIAI
jgi:hypothetical protein